MNYLKIIILALIISGCSSAKKPEIINDAPVQMAHQHREEIQNDIEPDLGADNLVMENKHTILFEYNSAKISDPETIKQIAMDMQINPDDHIYVDGYTDRLGSDKYNQKLSEKRALAVKSALISAGVNKNKIYTQGHGKSFTSRCEWKFNRDLIDCLAPDRKADITQEENK